MWYCYCDCDVSPSNATREEKKRECAIPWLVTKTCTQQRNRVAIYICHILSISWLWLRIRFQLVLFANTPSSTPIRQWTWQLSLNDSASVCSLSDFLAVSVISAALPSLDYWTERPNELIWSSFHCFGCKHWPLLPSPFCNNTSIAKAHVKSTHGDIHDTFESVIVIAS